MSFVTEEQFKTLNEHVPAQGSQPVDGDGQLDETITPEFLQSLGLEMKDIETVTGKNQPAPTQKESKPQQKVEKESKQEKQELDELQKLLKRNEVDHDDHQSDDAEESEESESSEENEEEESEGEESEEVSDDEEAFELDHKGEKKSYSKIEVKELAQKGLDYTKKTQALANERKAFEAYQKETEAELERAVTDFEAKYAAFEQQASLLEQWNQVTELMKEDNPDLFSELQDYFKQQTRLMRNPMVDSKMKQLEKKIAELESKKSGEDLEGIRNTYFKELGELKDSIGPQLQQLKFTPNWDKVKQSWIESGGSVEQAFFRVYGSTLNKMYSSRVKTEKVNKQIKTKKGTFGGMKRGGQVGTPAKFSDNDLNNMSYSELAERLSQMY